MKHLIFILFLFVIVACSDDGKNGSQPKAYDAEAANHLLNELVKMSDGKLGDPVLLATIKRFNCPVRLSTDQMIELKKKGLSDKVIEKLISGFPQN